MAALTLVVVVAASAALPAHAVTVFNDCTTDPAAASTPVCKAAGTDQADSMIKIVINSLLYIIGIISVIMIIIGGLRYTLSGGDSSGTKSAKDTILYAVIGLVIAIMAFSIVNFVVGKF